MNSDFKNKRASIATIALVVLAVAWLFTVTFNYYIVHKPFSIANALALFDVAANIVVAGLVLLLASALGRRLLEKFKFDTPLEAIVFQAGLGLGVVSFATLGLGVAGLLNNLIFWVLIAASVSFLRQDLKSVWSDAKSLRFEIQSRYERLLAFFIVASLALAFLFALTPPTAWDAQTYHLVEAKVAMARGRIAAPPDIPYFSFPSLVEMLFLCAMLLKGDIAGQLIHFEFFLLTLGALFAFAQRYYNSSVAWLSLAILVAVPSLLLVATWAYVDLALAFYAFTAFFALVRAHESNHWKWYALAGTFAGLAMGVKYTGVIVPVALILLVAIGNWRLENRDSPIRFHSLILLFSAIVFASPWFLRNWLFTGNPVYPFFFGGAYWDAFRANWFGRFGSGLSNSPLQLLIAPWDATVYGVEGALGYEATIGPLLLALLPLPILYIQNPISELRNTQYALRNALIFSIILYAFWMFGIASSKLLLQTRLLFAAFPTLVLAGAVAIDRLGAFDFSQFSLQRFTRLLISVVLGLTLLSYALAFSENSPLAYLTGVQSREEFLARNLGDYARAIDHLNYNLPITSRVLSLWEPRSYYIQRDVHPDSILDSWAHELARTRDTDAIAAGWQRAGYSHILLNRQGLNLILTTGYDPIRVEDVRLLQDLLARHARLVYGEPLEIKGLEIANVENSAFAIYELRLASQ